jgi:hypothetical protein
VCKARCCPHPPPTPTPHPSLPTVDSHPPRPTPQPPYPRTHTHPSAAVASYCTRLATTAMWGDLCEVRALSALLASPIRVFRAGQEPIHVEPEGEDGSVPPGPELTLSFHEKFFVLGNHYNSVEPAVPRCGDDE